MEKVNLNIKQNVRYYILKFHQHYRHKLNFSLSESF